LTPKCLAKTGITAIKARMRDEGSIKFDKILSKKSAVFFPEEIPGIKEFCFFISEAMFSGLIVIAV
jgi:hypothetical protein